MSSAVASRRAKPTVLRPVQDSQVKGLTTYVVRALELLSFQLDQSLAKPMIQHFKAFWGGLNDDGQPYNTGSQGPFDVGYVDIVWTFSDHFRAFWDLL